MLFFELLLLAAHQRQTQPVVLAAAIVTPTVETAAAIERRQVEVAVVVEISEAERGEPGRVFGRPFRSPQLFGRELTAPVSQQPDARIAFATLYHQINVAIVVDVAVDGCNPPRSEISVEPLKGIFGGPPQLRDGMAPEQQIEPAVAVEVRQLHLVRSDRRGRQPRRIGRIHQRPGPPILKVHRRAAPQQHHVEVTVVVEIRRHDVGRGPCLCVDHQSHRSGLVGPSTAVVTQIARTGEKVEVAVVVDVEGPESGDLTVLLECEHRLWLWKSRHVIVLEPGSERLHEHPGFVGPDEVCLTVAVEVPTSDSRWEVMPSHSWR